ncbi:hypothetical protein BofuT4_uP011200.1 [Botrytis cinerea T4]|uniref:Uncharacterized protein n=1 Tax=Botryotinia fuckeliana (strain T4) TaxID=999810 RepID=G2XTF8_BOTF4|nr:hypothetical protein BofuT4_uP011200.1 [Botrytis cinerea T4]
MLLALRRSSKQQAASQERVIVISYRSNYAISPIDERKKAFRVLSAQCHY